MISLLYEWTLENSDALIWKKNAFSREIIYSEKWKLYDAGKVSSAVKLVRVSLGQAFKHAYVKLFFFTRVGSEWQKHSSWCVITEWFCPVGFCTALLPEHFSKKLFFWVSYSSKILIAAKWCKFCQEVETILVCSLPTNSVYIRRIWLDSFHVTQPWYYDA